MSGFELWWARGIRALGVLTALVAVLGAAWNGRPEWVILVVFGTFVAIFAHGVLNDRA